MPLYCHEGSYRKALWKTMTILIPSALEVTGVTIQGTVFPCPLNALRHCWRRHVCMSPAPDPFHPSRLPSFLVQICNVVPQTCDLPLPLLLSTAKYGQWQVSPETVGFFTYLAQFPWVPNLMALEKNQPSSNSKYMILSDVWTDWGRKADQSADIQDFL